MIPHGRLVKPLAPGLAATLTDIPLSLSLLDDLAGSNCQMSLLYSGSVSNFTKVLQVKCLCWRTAWQESSSFVGLGIRA